MRAFISVDMEGMPYIVSLDHLAPKRPLFREARNIMTEIVKVVAEALHDIGFDEVIVADSHGYMVNIIVSKLPDYVKLVRGFPRPMSMVTGAEGCDIALFLGYHAKFGTEKSTLDHTYSGFSVRDIRINGVSASEFLLNAYAVGEYGIPVVLVAGEEKLLEGDVAKFTPWAERVTLKKSFSRYAAISPSLRTVEKLLREAIIRAIEKYRSGICKPIKPSTPVTVEIEFNNSGLADIAEMLPYSKRVNPLTIAFKAESMKDAYKTIELLVMATLGLRYLLQS